MTFHTLNHVSLTMNTHHFHLAMLPIEEVFLHEETDIFRVAKLKKRIETSGILRNPPIVANMDSGYVVLDGATRTTSLKEIGASHILAQVVHYGKDGIDVETWNHILPDMSDTDIIQTIGSLQGLRLTETNHQQADDLLLKRQIAGYIYCSPSTSMIIETDTALGPMTSLLRTIVATYKKHGEIYRLAQNDLEQIIAKRTEHSAVMVFPRFTPDEIRTIAQSEQKLPAGITRHIIPGRVLNVNIPLDWLIGAGTTAEKTQWLDAWLSAKIVDSKVRYYHEPVFIFDE